MHVFVYSMMRNPYHASGFTCVICDALCSYDLCNQTSVQTISPVKARGPFRYFPRQRSTIWVTFRCIEMTFTKKTSLLDQSFMTSIFDSRPGFNLKMVSWKGFISQHSVPSLREYPHTFHLGRYRNKHFKSAELRQFE